ncbi:Fusaric acid resistance protein family protein [Planctomycetes bacterium CA13]|uniref:Fusaric acid resistance protein family protein n=1 Tax=Novipirellula herctigrandis TaxID=2527986 RepID=A0A5C5Z1R0_9BACT|nr:Fusaric acid resistance protein family protein [Planctomycetes bacterium CA13]
MKSLFLGLDSARLLLALKTCLAIVLALGITLSLDWKPSFMAILMVTMQTAFFGATFKKTILYILGTLSGSMTGVAMIAMFAHDRRLFILGMVVLTGIGLYRLQKSREPYAWMIFLVTLALAGWLPAAHPSAAFDIAVMRATTICVGVIVVYCVHGIILPVRAGKAFERQLSAFVDGCRHIHSLVSSAVAGNEPDVEALRRAETAQIKTIAALRSTLDAATVDTKRFKQFHVGYQQLIGQLQDLLLALLSVRSSITSSRNLTSPIMGDHLHSTMQMIDGELRGLASDLVRERDAEALNRESTTGESDLGRLDTSESLQDAMIADQLNIVASSAAKVRAALACVEDPGQTSPPPPSPTREPFSLRSVQVQKAALGSVVMLLTILLFIQTQWPMGLSLAMIFLVLAICFNCLMPLMMISRQMLLSLLVGPLIAAVLYFGIMPRIDQYVELIPWLVVVFVPLLYWQSNPKPQASLLAMFSSLFLIALLSLDEQRQSYSFSSFFEMWLGLCGGFGVPVLIFGLFSTVVPEQKFLTQVRSFFAGCGQSMQSLTNTPPDSPATTTTIQSGRKQRLGLIKQMHMWSRLVNYRRFPDAYGRRTQAMVESIQRAALWLESAEDSRRKSVDSIPDPLRDPYQRLYDTCAASFQSIADALANLEPAPDLPDTTARIRDIESQCAELRRSAAENDEVQASVLRTMIATAHLRWLANAISDCCDNANHIDWKEWNRNHF